MVEELEFTVSKLHPKIGEMIKPMFSCNLWDENLDEIVDEVYRGECLLVLATSNKKRPKRINPDFYRMVLSPRGVAGWIHLDNCDVFE